MTEPVVFDRSPWGLVVVSGPDATSFLQAIVSQDLDPVDDGETVASLLLHPQGKLDVAFRATKRGDTWWLDTDPEFGAHLRAARAQNVVDRERGGVFDELPLGDPAEEVLAHLVAVVRVFAVGGEQPSHLREMPCLDRFEKCFGAGHDFTSRDRLLKITDGF